VLVSKNFKKTAVHFHYEFNIRHLSGIFSGILLSTPKNFIQNDKIPKLWLHESNRVYGDRLSSRAHVEKFQALCAESAKSSFKNIGNLS